MLGGTGASRHILFLTERNCCSFVVLFFLCTILIYPLVILISRSLLVSLMCLIVPQSIYRYLVQLVFCLKSRAKIVHFTRGETSKDCSVISAVFIGAYCF